MDDRQSLTAALQLLGELLQDRGLAFELVVIGGAALLLRELVARPDLDLDAVARVENDRWLSAKPLPIPLVEAIRAVGRALDLPHEPRDDKDWLNSGPSILLKLGLPGGFAERCEVHRFGGLTLHLAAREDLVTLKLWSATDIRRGARRSVDIADLRALAPTVGELRHALGWCREKDGRESFFDIDAAPVLRELGVNPEDLRGD